MMEAEDYLSDIEGALDEDFCWHCGQSFDPGKLIQCQECGQQLCAECIRPSQHVCDPGHSDFFEDEEEF